MSCYWHTALRRVRTSINQRGQSQAERPAQDEEVGQEGVGHGGVAAEVFEDGETMVLDYDVWEG